MCDRFGLATEVVEAFTQTLDSLSGVVTTNAIGSQFSVFDAVKVTSNCKSSSCPRRIIVTLMLAQAIPHF